MAMSLAKGKRRGKSTTDADIRLLGRSDQRDTSRERTERNGCPLFSETNEETRRARAAKHTCRKREKKEGKERIQWSLEVRSEHALSPFVFSSLSLPACVFCCSCSSLLFVGRRKERASVPFSSFPRRVSLIWSAEQSDIRIGRWFTPLFTLRKRHGHHRSSTGRTYHGGPETSKIMWKEKKLSVILFMERVLSFFILSPISRIITLCPLNLPLSRDKKSCDLSFVITLRRGMHK